MGPRYAQGELATLACPLEPPQRVSEVKTNISMRNWKTQTLPRPPCKVHWFWPIGDLGHEAHYLSTEVQHSPQGQVKQHRQASRHRSLTIPAPISISLPFSQTLYSVSLMGWPGALGSSMASCPWEQHWFLLWPPPQRATSTHPLRFCSGALTPLLRDSYTSSQLSPRPPTLALSHSLLGPIFPAELANAEMRAGPSHSVCFLETPAPGLKPELHRCSVNICETSELSTCFMPDTTEAHTSIHKQHPTNRMQLILKPSGKQLPLLFHFPGAGLRPRDIKSPTQGHISVT